ncbi:LutC/YkgG family protein [Pseudoduganella lutea]|uniref:Lactate utilization protein C n=1 Tax=Pseudoduganella lutea TaxID=321985 RepID=A0A4P6L5P6_9BURK|nr:LUD domain-containing protein [Pseudoduganella lutea]QBE66979.1 lactate utilization protein C [Pseudoduganella lutea]
MHARERMLGRLRAAAPAPVQDALTVLDSRIAAHHAHAQPEPGQLADALEAALRAARAEVFRAGIDEWPSLLADRLAHHGVKRLLLDCESPEGAALARALPAQVETLPFRGPLETWKPELFGTVDAGFTVARSGIAATGTLVLAPDAGTPRTVSLVPPLHVALVHAESLHATLFDAALAERWRDGMPTNLVLASGPSKTSDIQQTLAFGAHGPRWMWVVIVTGRRQA